MLEKIHAISVHEAGHAVVMAHSRHFLPLCIRFTGQSAHVELGLRVGVEGDIDTGLPGWERIMISMAGYVANQVELHKERFRDLPDRVAQSIIESGIGSDIEKWRGLIEPLISSEAVDRYRDELWNAMCSYFLRPRIWAQVQSVAKQIEVKWASLSPGEQGALSKTEVRQAIDRYAEWDEDVLPIPESILHHIEGEDDSLESK